MRGLSEKFMGDLKEGELKPLLDAVKKDDTLCLEIRENYINIYYRGGNICAVTQNNGNYQFVFDEEYVEENKEEIKQLFSRGDVKEIVQNIPMLKSAIDVYFIEKKANLEREFQQLILRENNCSSISNGTDYYISDIEYANSENKSRFDMIAIKWPSIAQERRFAKNIKLAFIEVKYGDGALVGNAGIQKHIQDIYTFLTREKNEIYQEAEKIINQKIELEIIDIQKNVTIQESKPEFILICANHDPASTVLKREIKAAMQTPEYKELREMCDLKLATSSLMGYGLYDDCMVSFEEFLNEEE